MNKTLLFIIYAFLISMAFRASYYFNDQGNNWGYHGFGILGVMLIGFYGDACIKREKKERLLR